MSDFTDGMRCPAGVTAFHYCGTTCAALAAVRATPPDPGCPASVPFRHDCDEMCAIVASSTATSSPATPDVLDDDIAIDQLISAGTGARSAVVRDPGNHDWPASALGATDVLDPDNLGLRDLRSAARAAGVSVPTPDTSHGTPTEAARCQCGQLVGRWNRTHHKPGAKVGDKPCELGWKL